uniref:Uncharacterized protein n=1 Tax=Molossus molossus TaxID=27622 RepID=A0A7J8F8V0_MOLMO|nr:hypothetical protein HJG59_008473 [Molossus molossus]
MVQDPFMTSFHLNHFLRDPIFKYTQTGDYDFTYTFFWAGAHIQFRGCSPALALSLRSAVRSPEVPSVRRWTLATVVPLPAQAGPLGIKAEWVSGCGEQPHSTSPPGLGHTACVPGSFPCTRLCKGW